MEQKLIYTNEVDAELGAIVDARESAFVLVDSNTQRLVLPLLESLQSLPAIVIPAGDTNKNAKQLGEVWRALSHGGATRRSLLINLGGGVVTDLGGFAAATFKRGIDCVNVPTTLLGAVDAAVGGKTGINFAGLKNEVGAFAPASQVVISSAFFATLPRTELLSGYAEMLKHGLLKSKRAFARLINYDISAEEPDTDAFLQMVKESVEVKEEIVRADPKETGLRKALNLGHTAGHAFESFAAHSLKLAIPHGYAVAWGLVVALILSHTKLKMPTTALHALTTYVRENYGTFVIDCSMYPELLSLMHHDKKNEGGDSVWFTLLSDVGRPQINVQVSDKEITEALDIFREM